MGLQTPGTLPEFGHKSTTTANCVTLGKLFNSPLSQFPPLENSKKCPIVSCCVNTLRKNTKTLLRY